MITVGGRFSLTALFDGTTLTASLYPTKSLVQFYRGTDKNIEYIPDFEKNIDKQPIIRLGVMNLSTGTIITNISNITWKYNEKVLTFDEKGVCTNKGLEGTFKKVTDKLRIDNADYTVPALRICKNLVRLTNYDNDRITAGGTVEINGSQINFKEAEAIFTIKEASANSYYVVIKDNNGRFISSDFPELTVVATLWRDGTEIDLLTGYNFTWYKLEGDGDKVFEGKGGPGPEGATIKIGRGDVDNVLLLRCDVSIQSGEKLASGYAQITDKSDPYYVEFKIDGITGNLVRLGQTAVITPYIKKRELTRAALPIWSWNLRNNKGEPCDTSGNKVSSSVIKEPSISLSYNALMNASGGITGTVSILINEDGTPA